MKPTLDNTPKPATLGKGQVSHLSQQAPSEAKAGIKSIQAPSGS